MSSAAQREAVAIKTPQHLKRFLEESGRRYIVIDAVQLVDALNVGLGWPMGARWFQALTQYLREWRMTNCSPIVEPCTKCRGAGCAGCAAGVTTRFRNDALEPDELRAVRDWIDAQLIE